jgi:membrane protease subunit HflK
MFDRLFDFIESVWEWLIPWVIIDAYEMGVVLRFGKFSRVIGPGLRIIWPLGIEAVKYDTVVRQTAYLDQQSLTTQDDKNITLAGIITFEIVDIRKFLLDIDEGETDMSNMVYGVISDEVEATNWKGIKGRPFNNRVLKKSREVCDEYCGVRVIHIKWSDKATARNIRLWTD